MSEVIINPVTGGDPTDAIHGDIFVAEGRLFSYTELFRRFANSDYGVFQASQAVRYSNKYDYGREPMLADLGDDIHPVDHMSYTESAIFRLVAAGQNTHESMADEQFSEEEIAAGRLAVLLHDIGECEHPDLAAACGETIGDVNYWLKTDAHEKAEVKIREHLYAQLYTDVPADTLALAEDTICNGVKADTLLRAGFKVTEFIGYYTTSLVAGSAALRLQSEQGSDTHDLRFNQLRQMALDMIPVWQERVGAFAAQFPHAGVVTDSSEPLVQEIYDRLH